MAFWEKPSEKVSPRVVVASCSKTTLSPRFYALWEKLNKWKGCGWRKSEQEREGIWELFFLIVWEK